MPVAIADVEDKQGKVENHLIALSSSEVSSLTNTVLLSMSMIRLVNKLSAL